MGKAGRDGAGGRSLCHDPLSLQGPWSSVAPAASGSFCGLLWRRAGRVNLGLGLRLGLLKGQVGGTGDGGHCQLREGIVLAKDEVERAQVGDFQRDLSAPTCMDRRGGEVNQDAGPGLGTLCVYEANQLGMPLRGRRHFQIDPRSADSFFRRPQQEAEPLYHDLVSVSAAKDETGVGLPLCWFRGNFGEVFG